MVLLSSLADSPERRAIWSCGAAGSTAGWILPQILGSRPGMAPALTGAISHSFCKERRSSVIYVIISPLRTGKLYEEMQRLMAAVETLADAFRRIAEGDIADDGG